MENEEKEIKINQTKRNLVQITIFFSNVCMRNESMCRKWYVIRFFYCCLEQPIVIFNGEYFCRRNQP